MIFVFTVDPTILLMFEVISAFLLNLILLSIKSIYLKAKL